MTYIKENSFVYSKERGMILISQINVGDSILYRKSENEDFYTKVLSKDCKQYDEYIKIKCNNGSYVCLNQHSEFLTYNNEYIFSNTFNSETVITPNKNDEIFKYNVDVAELGWFLGMHTGDGTSDRKLIKLKDSEYYKYRIRINGDNEEIIKRYSDYVNQLIESDRKYNISTRKEYKSVVWQYDIISKNVEKIIINYFDGQFGKKIYDGIVYSKIVDNNLWIPYIAGLVDSDGAIKENGTIEISICMKDVIESLCLILSKSGIRYHITCKTSVRENEKPLYRLTIYLNEHITNLICDNMGHKIKINKIKSGNPNKFFSTTLYNIGDLISNRILSEKINTKLGFKYITVYSVKELIKKRNGHLGLGGLNMFKNLGTISNDEYNEIIRREPIKDKVIIKEPSNFISLQTESGNFYTGNFGLVNVKC